MVKTKGVWKWHGKEVPVTFLQGEPYMEVATKIALAHEDGGFTEVSHEFLKVGEKDVVRICIEFKGNRFFGSAQIKWGGKNADATDPIENAETSAKGRALSAAGYQINSVASAEDMEHVSEPEPATKAAQPPKPTAAASTDDAPASAEQLTSIRKLCAALGREEPDPVMLSFAKAGAIIRQLSRDYNQRRKAS